MNMFGGGRYDDERDSVGTAVIRPSGRCNVAGCDREAVVYFAACFAPDGSAIVLPAGNVVTRSWRIKPGYTLRGWLERCAACYSAEQLRDDRRKCARDGLEHPLPDWTAEPYRSVCSAEKFMAHFGGRSVGACQDVSAVFEGLGRPAT